MHQSISSFDFSTISPFEDEIPVSISTQSYGDEKSSREMLNVAGGGVKQGVLELSSSECNHCKRLAAD
jgi:hypothetical protein